MKTAFFHNFLRSLMLPLKEIDTNLPQVGTILDLGCGEGVIARYLATNSKRKVIGVDLNKSRIQQTKLKNLSFEHADIRTYDVKSADGVVLSDVLHHIDFQNQEKVLKNISKGLKRNGILIIKEIDTRDAIRGKLSRFWDFVFYPREKIYFNSSKQLSAKLEKLGFSVEIKKTTKFFPGSTTLFICTK